MDVLKNIKITEKGFNNYKTSLHSLTAKDYPGFFTVKNFLIMLNGVYSEKFLQQYEC